MAASPTERLRPLLLAVYPVAALVVVTPLFDLVSSALPLQPGSTQWRYGFLGLLGNFILTPLLGAVMASFAAAALDQRKVLKVLSTLYAVISAALLAAMAFFILDVLQLRGQIQTAMQGEFRTGALISIGKYLAGILALGILSLGGFKTGNRLPAPAPRNSARTKVVGSRA